MEFDPDRSYNQPLRDFVKRTVIDEVEDIIFAPNSNIRIWYNFQVESYAKHSHTAAEVVIPVENGYKYIADGRKFHLNCGDILIIPPSIPHEVECDTEGKRFVFLFELDFLKRMYDFDDLSEFLKEPQLINTITHPDTYKKIYNLFLEIVEIYFNYTSKLYEMSIFARLTEVFAILAQDESSLKMVNLTNDKQHKNFYKFKSLIAYINTHYMDNISLEYAATFVGFSKFHFARMFKDFTNSSFYDYLCHRRITAAKTLLEDDSLSITEVGRMCGFTNQSTFTRSFSAHAGYTPSKYRQQIRQSRS